MKKNLIKITIILSMLLLTLIPLSVSAATSGTCGDNLTWILDNNGILTISGTGAMGTYNSEVLVPWYKIRNSIKSVKVSDGVTYIAFYSFYDCDNLTKVELGNDIKSIGHRAFSYCSSLESVILPDSVATLDLEAFSHCSNLKWISIPATINKIENYAFYDCGKLSNIYYANNNTSWDSITIGKYNSEIENATVKYLSTNGVCGEKLIWELYDDGTLFIKGNGNMDDFYYWSSPWNKSKVSKVIITNGVTSIGNNAFYNCTNLKEIVFADTIISIGDYSFKYAKSITDFVLNEGLTTIGQEAFSYCSSLTNITFPSTLNRIKSSAFKYCDSLTNLYISDINAWCNVKFESFSSDSVPLFYADNLYLNNELVEGQIILEDGITYIGAGLAYCYSITDIKIPDSVTTIDKNAFFCCRNLTNVILSNKISTIQENTFYGCKNLKSIDIPNGVKYIYGAFSSCDNLESIILPNSLTTINQHSFSNCTNLATVKYKGTEYEWKKIYISETGNEYLINANIIYNYDPLSIYTQTKKNDNCFIVTPVNIPINKYIIFVCYNGNKMVYVNPYVYVGETTIPFTTTETYDEVKVMVWENLETCVPLCEPENVPLN